MTGLGPLQHFLGISVQKTDTGIQLSQSQYAKEILDRAKMTNCNSCLTPIDTKSQLSSSNGLPVSDPTEYRQLAGALQY